MIKIKYSNLQLKMKTLEQYMVTKILIGFPKADELEQDDLEVSGDKRPSTAMSGGKKVQGQQISEITGKHTA